MSQAQISPAQAPAGPAPPADFELLPDEYIVAEAKGVRLGWQWQTVLVWWIPGLAFIALAWLEFHSLVVTAGLAVFCFLLFLFYAQDREVRPKSARKHYYLTDRRLLIVSPGRTTPWKEVPLSDIVDTRMEEGRMDRVVASIARAATLVLELKGPGAKGEPRRLRLGPVRRPGEFRARIDAQLRAR